MEGITFGTQETYYMVGFAFEIAMNTNGNSEIQILPKFTCKCQIFL